MKLEIKARPGERRFGRKMEHFVAYAEHLGLMLGGGWNTKDKTAEFFAEAHRTSCCDKLPGLNRITPAVKAKVMAWLSERGLGAKVGR